MIDWEIRAREMANCNCAPGCPCQFNSRPTSGDCRAVVGIEIDTGRFGETRLDGARVILIASWPGAIHEGHGTAQIIVDQTCSQDQRSALLRILGGEETAPGATVFNVFASTMETVHDPIYLPVELDIDVERRRGTVRVEGIVQSEGSPIVNPVTGQEHRARIDLPHGFEYRIAEVARGTSRVMGSLAFEHTDGHAHFAHLHLTGQGVAN